MKTLAHNRSSAVWYVRPAVALSDVWYHYQMKTKLCYVISYRAIKFDLIVDWGDEVISYIRRWELVTKPFS